MDFPHGYLAPSHRNPAPQRDQTITDAVYARAIHMILRHGYGAPAAMETAERMWLGALNNAGGNVEHALANFKPEIK